MTRKKACVPRTVLSTTFICMLILQRDGGRERARCTDEDGKATEDKESAPSHTASRSSGPGLQPTGLTPCTPAPKFSEQRSLWTFLSTGILQTLQRPTGWYSHSCQMGNVSFYQKVIYFTSFSLRLFSSLD